MALLTSIGVPTYNRVALLQRSVPHMLAQDYPNIEVVISDNASTDGTQAYCEGLARSDSRVRYFRQERNIGPSANYAAVLRLATGHYYMNLADDDDIAPSYVSKCVATLEADPDLLVACGRALMYRDGNFVREAVRTNLLDPSPAKRVVEYYATVLENSAFHGVIRREVLASLPSLASGMMGADWLYMAAIAFSGRIKTIEDAIIIKHEGGASRDMPSIARVLGLNELHGRYSTEYIIRNAVRDIVWSSPVYASLGPAKRIALGSEVAAALVHRFRERWLAAWFYRMLLRDFVPPKTKAQLIRWRNRLRERVAS